MPSFLSRTFRSLRTRNYRLYFSGQAVSYTGDWIQSVAQMWLVYEITGSGAALGVTTALQFGPVLAAGAWGGVIADRVDKRRLLMISQTLKGGLALVLGALTVTGVVELWMVYALAFLTGCVNSVDNPARRAFMSEMSGLGDVANAVSLNSFLVTVSRIVGPGLAALLISAVGTGPCFLINGVSYGSVLIAIAMMRASDLHRGELVEPRRGQIREGIRYAMKTPEIRLPLLMMLVVGVFAYNFRVVLPLIASDTFNGGAGLFGVLLSVMSVGSVGGALFTASRAEATSRYMVLAGLAFGVAMLGAAAAPTLILEFAVLIAVGAASAAFTATVQATLQVSSADRMRGRVMALYSVVFLGSTPIGGPIVGWISEQFGPRFGLALGGMATAAVSLMALRSALRKAAPIGTGGTFEPVGPGAAVEAVARDPAV